MKHTIKLFGAAAMIVLAIITSGCDDSNNDTGASTRPAAIPSAETAPTPKSDLCQAIDAIDMSSLLGDNQINRTACKPDYETGTLAGAIWTRQSDGVRMSVMVISNEGDDGMYAPFAYLQEYSGEEYRCVAVLQNGTRNCLDHTSLNGVYTVDMGGTYVSVWQSQQSGTYIGGMPVDAARGKQIRDFADAIVAPAIYG